MRKRIQLTYIGFLLSYLNLQNAYSDEQRIMLEELFVECNGLLYGYIYQMMGDVDQSLDFMQESFIRLLNTGKEFSDKKHIKNYLFRIARNLCIAAFRDRKMKQHLSVENLEEKGFIFQDGSEDQLQKIQTDEIEGMLTDFIRSRPERERTIMTLKKMQGIRYEDLAEITDLSVRQLKRIVKSELDLFAAMFAEQGILQMEDLV